MYIIKATLPNDRAPVYFSKYTGWSFDRRGARRYKAEELIPLYQDLVADFRTSDYILELVRVED